jgi:7-cyano-7-deazaguanine synthase in queuosine biosynthesis
MRRVSKIYLNLISSGLDSTATLLKVINEEDLKESLILPLFIWWKDDKDKVLKKECKLCDQLLDYIRNKYENLSDIILKKEVVKLPFVFFEDLITKTKGLKLCWPYYRNGIFIFSSLSFLMNFLQLIGLNDINRVVIAAGFIGNEEDENDNFLNNLKNLFNSILNDTTSRSSKLIKEIEFYIPYINTNNLSKASRPYFDIEKFGDEEILKFTWSCWQRSNKQCLSCGGCQTRESKYSRYKRQNGKMVDPLYNHE